MSNWKTDHLSSFVPAPRENDPRWGHQLIQPKEYDWVLCGYPDDEGIKNNGGRPGSAEGPKGFRQVFYKMTPHLLKSQDDVKDHGDLIMENIRVHFANGDDFEPQVKHEFKEGDRTRDIDLPGGERHITKVDFHYRSERKGDKATVVLYGKEK